MKIYPAIDIYEGKCVRLFQGNFDQKVDYSRDPLQIALAYQSEGAEYLHLVDLDGARSGSLVNVALLERIASKTTLSIDYGGGIKSKEDIQTLLEAGARQVSVGTSAVREPALFIEWLSLYGDSIILSADVNQSQIVIAGWQQTTTFTASELIRKFEPYGLKFVSCTDVSKDGTMAGPALALYRELAQEFPAVGLIASGGVSSLKDISELKETGAFGAIIGKALLDGIFRLKEALEVVK